MLSKKLELDTPCLLIDKAKLEYNLKRMQSHADAKSIKLRPHVKTHKCSKLAAFQMQYGAVGISAAKLSEALQLIEMGISNILITSPIVSSAKIAKLMEILKKAPETLLVVDNEQNLDALNLAAKKAQQQLNLLLDLDPGIGRTGIRFQDDSNGAFEKKALDFVRKIQQAEWLHFSGIQCYAGNLQHMKDYQERKDHSQKIMAASAKFRKAIEKQGIACPILTGTGTGTYDIDSEVPGVTEIQPGSYTVMDVDYACIGSKENPKAFERFLPAMTMLCTVISSNRKEHITVDAGTKSLYFDPVHKPKIISHPDLVYDWGGFGDEHGKVSSITAGELPPAGTVLEMIVPHCDPTINLFDKFYIIEEDNVIDVWEIDLRGKSQ